MSVLRSLALQTAVYAALSGDPALSALVEGRIYDAPLHGDDPAAAPGPWVLLGDERVRAWNAEGLVGGVHEFDVSVIAPGGGFRDVKTIAAEVERVLSAPLPALSSGRIATRGLRGARAYRIAEGGRRIDLRFVFRVEA